MATITPENGKKFTASEKKAIKQAEAIAKKIQKLHQESKYLLYQLGSNPFLVKKGIAVTCNAETEQIANRVVFKFDCTISVPEEIIK